MRIAPLFLASAALLLAACGRVELPSFLDAGRSSSSAESSFGDEAAFMDEEDGELEVTPEPFVDPLAPLSLTGAIAFEERTLSGVLLEIGSPDAPHVMSVYLNPESAYARQFHNSRMHLVLSTHVARGDLAVRYTILPIEKFPGSASSARTISCAARQGKGFPTLDALFLRGATSLDPRDVTKLELDAAAFADCMEESNDPLTYTSQNALRAGITLVPTYVIDGETVVGLPTQADLMGTLGAALR